MSEEGKALPAFFLRRHTEVKIHCTCAKPESRGHTRKRVWQGRRGRQERRGRVEEGSSRPSIMTIQAALNSSSLLDNRGRGGERS